MITVTAPGTAYRDEILGWDFDSGDACWVWWYPFSPNYGGSNSIYILNCFNDTHCSSSEYCDKSSSWSNWDCVSDKSDGQSCTRDEQCSSGYCDADGVGLSDDGHCFAPYNTYFDGQETSYCEYSTGLGHEDCDERQVGDDLNFCSGISFYEEECSSSCGYTDVTSVFECDETGCNCGEMLCEGLTEGDDITTCSSEQTYFADNCTASATGQDRGDNICRSSSFHTNCTADALCNGIVNGTGDCNSTCNYYNFPTTNLIFPTNNSVDMDGNVIFNCSASEANDDLINITLWINGVANETKSLSGTSDSATFEKSLINGIYEWTCLAYNNDSFGDWADENWTLNISIPNQAPTIPTNLLCDGQDCINNGTFSNNIEINCSGSTDNENDVITYFIDAYYYIDEMEQKSIDYFNNSATIENITFNDDENITRYLSIPRYAIVTKALINLSGDKESSCYQESVNQSTAGDGDCGLNYNGLWEDFSEDVGSTWSNLNNTYDGSWDNYGNRGGGINTITDNITYYKPSNFVTAVWQVKDGNNVVNLSIPDICFNNYSDKVVLHGFAGTSISWWCFNGTGPKSLRDVSNNFYEEAIIWIINDTTNPFLAIGDINVWNYTGVLDHTNNQTSNFASTLNDALNSGACDCDGCSLDENNCIIPFIFHSDTAGILEYSYMNISYNISGYTWNSIGNHSEEELLNWDISNINSQSEVDLKCRAIDLEGNNTYSSYFNPAVNLTIFNYPNDTYKFYIKNSTNDAVAWLGDLGNIMLRGSCFLGGDSTSCDNPGSDSFIIASSTDNSVASINSTGDLCVETGDCSDESASCISERDGFFIQNSSSDNVIFIDYDGDLCLTGTLYENSNP